MKTWIGMAGSVLVSMNHASAALPPDWDSGVDSGTVHMTWSADDWYQTTLSGYCQPRDYQFIDPMGGTLEPGSGDPDIELGPDAVFRYEAADDTRCVEITAPWSFSAWVPAYDQVQAGLPLTREVWVQISYFDDPQDVSWRQGWRLDVDAQGGRVSGMRTVGEQHDPATGLITEAYTFTVSGDSAGCFVDFNADPDLGSDQPAFVSAVTIDTLCYSDEPSVCVVSQVDGAGSVTPAATLLPVDGTLELAIQADDWHRIQSLSVDGVSVSDAIGSASYTLRLEGVTADTTNAVVFALRDDTLNPGQVPTAWLAGFGYGESDPFAGDRSVEDAYLLALDPYVATTIDFEVLSLGVEGSDVVVDVGLLADGQPQDRINGHLHLLGRPDLDSAWQPIDGTDAVGTVFSAGVRQYRLPVGSNRFFRAEIIR